jgi:hypothetical protein
VKANAVPAVAFAGAETVKWVAAAWLTVSVALPLIELVLMSAALIVWLPVVFKVALKVCVPAVKVLLPGKAAAPSLLVNVTVPG